MILLPPTLSFLNGTFKLWLQGPGPQARVVYIDGAFDLFHAGHVEVYCMNKLYFKSSCLNGFPWLW